MSISIKVAVRCRPFTKHDADLGVHLIQRGDEEGEVNLLKSKYSTNRFSSPLPFFFLFKVVISCFVDLPSHGLGGLRMVTSDIYLEKVLKLIQWSLLIK